MQNLIGLQKPPCKVFHVSDKKFEKMSSDYSSNKIGQFSGKTKNCVLIYNTPYLTVSYICLGLPIFYEYYSALKIETSTISHH